jgi:predicted Zn-dependent peptidase
VDAGSRDEVEFSAGMAHFTEHMLFKGTRKRKPFHILSRIDAVGGELNAYTTKEKTSYYSSTLSQYLDRSIDLLFDLVADSIFPDKEIEKEKSVIAEEIEMYGDNAEESILEDFEQLLYPNHPLGAPILGSKSSIQAIDRTELLKYFKQYYAPNRIAIGIVGQFDMDKTLKLIAKQQDIFTSSNSAPYSSEVPQRLAPNHQPVFRLSYQKSYQQAHLIIGGYAYPLLHEHYFCFLLLNYYLGGPSMNSRLSLHIREKYGLAYNLYSFYNPYLDTGIWGIYMGCDESNLNRSINLLEKDLKALYEEGLTTHRLANIKRQFIGHIVMSNEGLSAQMLSMAKDVLDFQRVIQLKEVVEHIEAISLDQFNTVISQTLDPQLLYSLTYLPEKES